MKKILLMLLIIVSSISPIFSQFQNYLAEENKSIPASCSTETENHVFSKGLSDKIALWLVPEKVMVNENLLINQWLDISSKKINANQTKTSRMPKLISEGINGFHSVKFEGNVKFGEEDIVTIDYHPAITTNLEFEDNTKKTLSIVFYCEDLSRKQVLFEAGGPVSGFNIYIEPPNILYFGIFKETKRVFLKQIINPGVHLVQLEFDGSGFRGILDGIATDYKKFDGIIYDFSLTGIGAASTGTRFHDFTTGVTCGYHFSGMMSEIVLMNDCNSSSFSKVVYDYLDKKYNIHGSYPQIWNKSTESDEHFLVESEKQFFKINNINNEYTLNFMIENNDNCKIEVYDLNGSLTEKIYYGEIKSNFEYNFTLNSSLYNSGIYYARLKGNKAIISTPFLVVR